MMSRAGPEFLRFIDAVHRRHLLWRLLERTGIGLFGGSIVGLVLLPLVLWTDKPALPVVSATLCFGAGIGAFWGIFRRPTRLDSAMQADRQLGLQDLLGSALSLMKTEGPWAAAVLAIADARCRQLKPRSILLSRVSARAWGGIGLSAAAVLALSLFFSSPANSRAAATASGASAGAKNQLAPAADEADRPLIALAPAVPPAAAEHDDPDGRSLGQTTPPRPGERGQPPSAQNADSSRHANSTASPGMGSGASQTDKHATATTPPHPQDNSHGPSAEHARAEVTTKTDGGGGPGQADRAMGTGAADPGGVVSNAVQGPRLTPPWKTDAWPLDVQRADAALDAGQISPAYQEMVRRYFER